MDELEELRAKKNRIHSELHSVNEEIRAWWLSYFKQVYNIYVGQRVNLKDGEDGIVSFIYTKYVHKESKPWIKVRRINKDGTVSKRETDQIYWKVKE